MHIKILNLFDYSKQSFLRKTIKSNFHPGTAKLQFLPKQQKPSFFTKTVKSIFSTKCKILLSFQIKILY